MAGDKEDKKKKSKTADGEKVKKEKSSDKEKKGDKKDKKSEKPEKKDSKDKKISSTGDKLIDRKIGADKKSGQNGAVVAPPKPKPRGPPPPKASNTDNYLGDIDLPPSESESDEEVEKRQVDESDKIFMARVRYKF